MNLISFAIESIVDANTGYRQLPGGIQLDTSSVADAGSDTRNGWLHRSIDRLRDAIAGRIERGRLRAERRRQLAELAALSDRSLRDIGLHRGDVHAVTSGQMSFEDLHRVRHQRSRRNLQPVATGRLRLPRASVNDSALVRSDCA